ncbi:uncharacterized protein PGRI_007550 [Penicillium griseofulvum]|uniref:Myb-like DNA-binding domain-containing protein n=1 Tax=Penicillium patulum TaxID=5078 RepID=A0A135LXP0_PENPA|nr:uncharacterized protein PGRI_007550 [Penicillium griseofulvum]KXG53705.1 hypothetical protein PGRI_007550 [Penicillium griseofulvum]
MMEDTTSPSPALALANVKVKVSKETTKASDEVFLLTLLEGVDYEGAAATLGITKAACRMRYTRLREKHGFKKVRAKRIPRGKKEAANTTKSIASKEADVTKDDANDNTEEATVEKTTEK